MSSPSTTAATGRRGSAAVPAQPAPASTPPQTPALAPPPKLKRRPLLVAASIAAVCLGALLAVWAYSSTSNAQDVLAMRETVNRGEVITSEDVLVASVGVDPALRPVSAERMQEVVGQRAALDLPAGGVVTEAQITSEVLPPEGESVVGLLATAAQMPAEQLQVGDTIRVVSTPGQEATTQVGTAQEGTTEDLTPPSVSATVAAIVPAADVSGATVVNVLVAEDQAGLLAARVSTGNVAIVLDSNSPSTAGAS